MSFFRCLNPLLAVGASITLTACIGTEEPNEPSSSSSSSIAAVSSSVVSSSLDQISSSSSSVIMSSLSSSSASSADSSLSFQGDPIRGKPEFTSCALICHTDNNNGTFSGTTPFDVNALQYSQSASAEELSEYLRDFMPKNNAGACTGRCADDIAAYLWTYRQSTNVQACNAAADEVVFAQRTLPLLTPQEYSNSVRDLFLSISNSVSVPEDYLVAPSANKTGGFPNTLNQPVNDDYGVRYFNNAISIADWNKDNGHLSCSSNNKTTCAQEFANGFAKMAFRRPLQGQRNNQNSEVGLIHQIFNDAQDIDDGIYWALVGTLTSPHFLYRSQLGIPVRDALNERAFNSSDNVFRNKLESLRNDNGAYVLTPYEYATSLSYFLTGSTPDLNLLDAAESGALNTQAGIEEQVERLLNTPKAEAHFKHFITLWTKIRLDRNSDLAAFDNNMPDYMIAELQEFFWHIFASDTLPFSELYTADYTFLNRKLAEHYGIPRSGGDDSQFIKTTIPASIKRGGLPTMGAFLASYAHGDDSAPILRAAHVREDMLCHHITPPGTLEEEPGAREEKARLADEAKAGRMLTTRRFYEIATHSAGPNDGCGTCHFYDINPLGATLEDFDGVGRWRSQQIAIGTDQDGLGIANVDIDARGALWGVENFKAYGEVVDIDGGRELSLALSQTKASEACFIEKAFRLAMNRPIKNKAQDLINPDDDPRLSPLEQTSFPCVETQLSDALNRSGKNAKAVIKELIGLDVIRFRQ